MPRHRGEAVRRWFHAHEERPASDYFSSWSQFCETAKVLLVVLYARVSTKKQKAKLADQISSLRKIVTKAGGVVLNEFYEVRNGASSPDGSQLEEAIEFARIHGGIVLAEGTSRFIRPEYYHPKKNPRRAPSRYQFQELDCLSANVPLVTLADPDLYEDEKRIQSIRGQTESGNRGGRPRKPKSNKNRKQLLLPRLKTINSTILDLSLRDLQCILNVYCIRENMSPVSHTTVGEWLNEC